MCDQSLRNPRAAPKVRGKDNASRIAQVSLDQPSSQKEDRTECGEFEFADNILFVEPYEQAVSGFNEAEKLEYPSKKAHGQPRWAHNRRNRLKSTRGRCAKGWSLGINESYARLFGWSTRPTAGLTGVTNHRIF